MRNVGLSPLRLARVWSLALVIACGGSPGEPDEPGDGDPMILANTLVTGELATGETRSYTYRSLDDINVVVHLNATAGAVTLSVRSATGQQLGGLSRSAPSTRLNEFGTDPIVMTAGTDYEVRLSAPSGGSYSISVAPFANSPEGRTALVQLDELVSESVLDRFDEDRYIFDVESGSSYTLFLRVIGPNQTTQAVHVSFNEVGGSLTTAGFGLDDQPRIRLAAGNGRMTIVIKGDPATPTDAYPRNYEFQVYRILPAPETAPATLIAGDTTTESINRNTDVDVFTVNGTPGALYSVFAQRLTTTGRELRIEASGTSVVEGPLVLLLDNAQRPLLSSTSGIMRAPASGTFQVTVSQETENGGLPAALRYRGDYRLLVAHIDSAPELVPPSLVLGGSVTGEVLSPRTDVDEFTMTVSAPTVGQVVLERPDGSGSLRLSVAPTGMPLAEQLTIGTGTTGTASLGTGRETWPAGTHRLRVRALLDDSYSGPYLLRSYVLDTLPEGVSPNVTVGVPVDEAIEPPGDLDRYVFQGTAGQHVSVTLDVPDPTEPRMNLQVESPDGTQGFAEGSGPIAGVMDTRRFTLPYTGTYAIRVLPNGSGASTVNRGAYRLLVTGLSGATETHAGTIAVGDTIATEATDTPGDVDEFVLQATPGQQVQVWLDSPDLRVDLFDPVTATVLGHADGFGARTPFVSMPPGGQVLVRVYETRLPCACAKLFTRTGSYRFAIVTPP